MHGIAHHEAQFFYGIALGGDGVTKGGGDKAAVQFVLTHFKNDLAHEGTIVQVT